MDEQRRILHQVAAGEVSPEDAARLIDDLEAGSGPPPPVRAGRVAVVRVRCGLADLRVVGDSSVAEAVVTRGSHEVTAEGDALVIAPGGRGRGFRFGVNRRFVGIGPTDEMLEVRVNPGLALEVDVGAGEARVTGMHGPITASVSVGALEIDDFQAPIDLQVKAGSVEARGRLDDGDSRVRCKLGEVRIELDPTSDVTISARARLGEVRLPDGTSTAGVAAGDRSVVLGDGTATLDVETAAGSVDVTSTA